MSIDTTAGRIFMRRGSQRIRFVQKHQGIDMDFHYLLSESGRNFDVRDLPDSYLQEDHDAVHSGDRNAHRKVIARALASGHSFNAVATKASVKDIRRVGQFMAACERADSVIAAVERPTQKPALTLVK